MRKFIDPEDLKNLENSLPPEVVEKDIQEGLANESKFFDSLRYGESPSEETSGDQN